ncbi:MAG TPA: pentapeptide repeat-containing protein, partial [Anaerolineae bacterium]|nr:pentapeptide repeat-containing protein [Anaerolineae bacterium]
AILFSADLTRADLRDTDLDQAENVSGARFDEALLPPGYRPRNNPRRSRYARGFFGEKKKKGWLSRIFGDEESLC